MGERGRNREIVERLALRVKEHHELRGERKTGEQAQREVAQMARVRGQQRAEGLHKNKKKGEASTRLREKQEREHKERVRSERHVGRVVVDFGKKG